MTEKKHFKMDRSSVACGSFAACTVSPGSLGRATTVSIIAVLFSSMNRKLLLDLGEKPFNVVEMKLDDTTAVFSCMSSLESPMDLSDGKNACFFTNAAHTTSAPHFESIQNANSYWDVSCRSLCM